MVQGVATKVMGRSKTILRLLRSDHDLVESKRILIKQIFQSFDIAGDFEFCSHAYISET